MLLFSVFAKLQHRPARQTALPSSSFSALTWLSQHSNLQPASRSSVAVEERRSRPGRDISTWLDPKSFPLNSFADPHPLTPVASILYKNSGGQGVPRSAIPCRHFASISPLNATLMNLPANVANKRLAIQAKPFICNTYKKQGEGACPSPANTLVVREGFFSQDCQLRTVDCQLIQKRGEMGTGARGAPVPVVGLYVKIKRAQFRNPGSHPNEGHVNSP
jgi:hypothetical protein